VTHTYHIAPARPQDLPQLPAIELAAARLLAGHAPQSVLNETTSLDVLRRAQRHGQLWVALAADEPVGFAHAELLERDAVHLEEIDVHPDHGRRGLGTKLVRQVCEWAARHGFESVTLTTFRDVPWNMPFYGRLGFSVVPADQLSASLRAVIDDETRRGLEPAGRVVMKRPSRWSEVNEMNDVASRPVDPTPEEVQYLEDRIYEFNASATRIADGAWLAFFVRERQRIVAGICGNTWGGTCEVRQFWVEQSRRGRGLGTRLFQAAEQEARRRGCTQIVLMTFSFQAPSFYERHGFETLATIEEHPRGHRNLLMRKVLLDETPVESLDLTSRRG